MVHQWMGKIDAVLFLSFNVTFIESYSFLVGEGGLVGITYGEDTFMMFYLKTLFIRYITTSVLPDPCSRSHPAAEKAAHPSR